MIRQTTTSAIVLLMCSTATAQMITPRPYNFRYDRTPVELPLELSMSAPSARLTWDPPSYDRPTAEPQPERLAYDELRDLAGQRHYYDYPYDNCQPGRHYSQADYRRVAKAIHLSPNTPSVTAFRQLSQTFSPAELRAIRLQYNQARIHERIADNRRRYSN